ncbi:hypothetical protein K439DRAFT_1626138, partial [Ramaria rubella]
MASSSSVNPAALYRPALYGTMLSAMYGGKPHDLMLSLTISSTALLESTYVRHMDMCLQILTAGFSKGS